MIFVITFVTVILVVLLLSPANTIIFRPTYFESNTNHRMLVYVISPNVKRLPLFCSPHSRRIFVSVELPAILTGLISDGGLN